MKKLRSDLREANVAAAVESEKKNYNWSLTRYIEMIITQNEGENFLAFNSANNFTLESCLMEEKVTGEVDV